MKRASAIPHADALFIWEVLFNCVPVICRFFDPLLSLCNIVFLSGLDLYIATNP